MFTIGNRKVYDEMVRRWRVCGTKFLKTGRFYKPKYYPGGIAFCSIKEARAFMAENEEYAGMGIYILIVPDNATEELEAKEKYIAYSILCDCQVLPLDCEPEIIRKAVNELKPYKPGEES